MATLNDLHRRQSELLQDRKQRRAEVAEAAQRQQELQEVRERVQKFCTLNAPRGKAGQAYFRQAETAFRDLAERYQGIGLADYLPAVTQTRREASDRDPHDREAAHELFVADLLLAACNKTRRGEIGSQLKQAEAWADGWRLSEAVEDVEGYLKARHSRGGELPPEKLTIEESEEPPVPATAAVKTKAAGIDLGQPTTSEPQAAGMKPGCVAARNLWFLQQWEARGTDTYRRPKQVWEKWQQMKHEERAAVSPDAPGKISHAAVAQGIKRARLSRAGKRKPGKKRKRTACKA